MDNHSIIMFLIKTRHFLFIPRTLTLFNLERILLHRIKISYQIIKHKRSSEVRSVVLNPELTDIWLGMNMYVEDVSITKETKVRSAHNTTRGTACF